MATHGKIGEFSSQREDWLAYSERLEEYFIANDIESSDKKKAILLSVVGAETYQLIRSLVAPAKPKVKTFDELVKLVQEHHQPIPSAIVQRYKFNSRTQQAGESIAIFVAELRRLAEHCKFGQTLDEMLRDRLVCGIADSRVQRRLLAEPDLTLKTALELAQAHEMAEKGTQQLQQRPQSSSLLKIGQAKTPNHRQQTARPPQQQPRDNLCYRCGGKHAGTCRFKDAICHKCKKKGHLARVCRSSKQLQSAPTASRPNQIRTSRTTNQVAVDDDCVSDTSESYELFNLQETRSKPLVVTVKLNNSTAHMELDTGASLSIISEKTFCSLWSTQARPELQSSSVKLHTYTKQAIEVLGSIMVKVTYKTQVKDLPLLVVAGEGSSLLGRNWLTELQLDWHELHQMTHTKDLQTILNNHSSIFNEELGKAVGITATLHVSDNAKPYFCRYRPIPHALKHKVETELQRLVEQRVIEPVESSEWAAPIVPVLKPDGTVRICGDYRLTINRAAKPDTYPLPRVEDLFANLAGGKAFSKLDLAHAYSQIPLTDSSKQYVTVNTHKGLYQYNRLPFGVTAAPSIFQRLMENLLQGIPRVSIYLDDILITGTSEADHLSTLNKVLTRLEAAGLHLKQNKCAFLLPSVEYLGHKITADGLQPTEEKVRAIKEAPPPTNVSQLRSFLGLVNYYSKFLPNLANTLAPLYSLLQKTKKWSWGASQKTAFIEAKRQLTSQKLLVHFDPSKELLLSCDASPYGIGAVLSHQMPDGTEQPIAFTS